MLGTIFIRVAACSQFAHLPDCCLSYKQVGVMPWHEAPLKEMPSEALFLGSAACGLTLCLRMGQYAGQTS